MSFAAKDFNSLISKQTIIRNNMQLVFTRVNRFNAHPN